MTIYLSADDIEDIKQVFQMQDTNGDGRVTKTELLNNLQGRNRNLSEVDVDAFLKLMDIDGDGTISFHEYLQMTARMAYRQKISAFTMRQIFREILQMFIL